MWENKGFQRSDKRNSLLKKGYERHPIQMCGEGTIHNSPYVCVCVCVCVFSTWRVSSSYYTYTPGEKSLTNE